MRVLLVEDEPLIAAAVKQGLEEDHLIVDVAHDGTTGLRMAGDRAYSLFLLDLMLPGTDGWTICRDLRARRDTTPILMLTARDAVTDRVQGLTMGADDYLTKPFDMRELKARVRALLRRGEVHKTPVINVADLSIDSATRTVTRAGKKVTLTGREFTLLEALARNEGRVLTREVILERVWMDEESYSNTVEVYIRTLRKKIDDEHPVKLIHTVRGSGYTLRRPDPVDRDEQQP
jgi:two-component system copper resistance phosphate regulon response regulator CusR